MGVRVFERLKKLLGWGSVTPPKGPPNPLSSFGGGAATDPRPAEPMTSTAIFRDKESLDMGIRFLIEKICQLQEELSMLTNAGIQAPQHAQCKTELEQTWRDLQTRAKMWRRYPPHQKKAIRDGLCKHHKHQTNNAGVA